MGVTEDICDNNLITESVNTSEHVGVTEEVCDSNLITGSVNTSEHVVVTEEVCDSNLITGSVNIADLVDNTETKSIEIKPINTNLMLDTPNISLTSPIRDNDDQVSSTSQQKEDDNDEIPPKQCLIEVTGVGRQEGIRGQRSKLTRV